MGYATALLVALCLPQAARAGTVTVDCSGLTAQDTADFEALAGCGVVGTCAPTDNIVILNSPCTPDFGTRNFNNKGKITVPNGGTFTLKAADITTDAKIAGKHTKATEGDGSHVTLTATGNITINKKVNCSGRLTSGSVALDADGNITLNQQVIARGQGGSAPTATGGNITIHADGTVSSIKRGKIVSRGKKKVTQAGVVDVSGNAGVSLKGRIEARGLYGGSVAATSSAGNINIEEEIRAYGEFGSGGTVNLTAAGSITIGGKKGTIKANGGAPAGAGTITLQAGNGIDAKKPFRAKGLMGNSAGIIDINADNGNVLIGTVTLTGDPGGSLDVAAQNGDIEAQQRIDASSKGSDGGHVGMISAGGNITVDTSISVNSSKSVGNGGDIFLQANGTALKFGASTHAKFDATGAVNGGKIDALCLAGNVEANGSFTATGGTMDGCIDIQDADNTATGSATFDPAVQNSLCP